MSNRGKVPFNFSSWEEYDGYINCLRQAKLGDLVVCYMAKRSGEQRFCPSNEPTLYTLTFPIIGFSNGFEYSKHTPLLGTNDARHGLWEIRAQYRVANYAQILSGRLLPCHLDIANFTHAYWAHSDDILIARLIRQ